MAGSSKDQVPRCIDSPCLSPLGTCFILFKVYFADDTVLSLDSELDPRLFATFGSAPIIRFHGYTPGNSYCVYELLTVFSVPVNVLSMGDLIVAAIQSIQQLEERALVRLVRLRVVLLLVGPKVPRVHDEEQEGAEGERADARAGRRAARAGTPT